MTRELLYDPFWESVKRIETVGLKVSLLCCLFYRTVLTALLRTKVMGATMDGCSVNRRRFKLHDFSAKLVYKTKNPFLGTYNIQL